MRILIDPTSYTCGNIGDLAMLQSAIERLRALWPEARISVITDAPEALRSYCPDVVPVPLDGRIAFTSDRFFGRVDRMFPRPLRYPLSIAQQHLQRRSPRIVAIGVAVKRALAGRPNHAAPYAYVNAVRRADLVVVTGAGVFTDAFIHNAVGVLDTLELAAGWGITTAMMGQGFGPVSNIDLRRRMALVLPQIDLIALRERREGARLLNSIGVSPDRTTVTGDDAIELANRNTPLQMGQAIGVNVRLAPYASVDGSMIHWIGRALRAAAERFDARLLAIPIAFKANCSDAVAIQQLIGSHSRDVGATGPRRTIDVVTRVSQCRMVVTGSYHAAVFALAQGIPVVAIVGSQYYRDKFSGLVDLFGGGCAMVEINAHDSLEAFETAMDRAWLNAPAWQEPLLHEARKQIERGQTAYRSLGALVEARIAGRPTTFDFGPRSSSISEVLPAPLAATREGVSRTRTSPG
jgi:colanic acid/amylovoran biosynthesis protein